MDVKIHSYHVASLQEIADVLQKGLICDFEEVSVTVVQCPDLTKEPFHLAAQGLNGSQRICDVGGVPYLLPKPNLDKKYNFEEVAKLAGVPNGFFLGAGAGPFHIVGTNSELMPNIKCGNGRRNETHHARITDDGNHLTEKVPLDSSDFALMSNVFLSEGQPGNVLRLHLKRRIGTVNLTVAIRRVLLEAFGPDKPIGLGGVFLIKKGNVRVHVMPKFSEEPINTDDEVGKWLRYFDVPAPLICLSVMSSFDPGWDLRIDHTHCFSTHGVGGHYHYDTTPDVVEYECYFNCAEKLVRIDQPKETHNVGRD